VRFAEQSRKSIKSIDIRMSSQARLASQTVIGITRTSGTVLIRPCSLNANSRGESCVIEQIQRRMIGAMEIAVRLGLPVQ
jgi:hypothetical protein